MPKEGRDSRLLMLDTPQDLEIFFGDAHEFTLAVLFVQTLAESVDTCHATAKTKLFATLVSAVS
jgi:hypothetical protein